MVIVATLALTSPAVSSQEEPDRLALRAQVTANGGFDVEIWSDLPPGSCARLSLGFEGDLVPDAEATVRLLARQVQRCALGPFPGRSLLRGDYVILARVDAPVAAAGATRADAVPGRVLARATAHVTVGSPEEAASDRSQVRAYAIAVVRECCARRQELRAAHGDLLARKRFVRVGNGSGGVDERAWTEFIEDHLAWATWAGEEHRRVLGRSLGAYYPRQVGPGLGGLVADFAALVSSYGNRGLAFCSGEAVPPEELIEGPGLDEAALEARFERTARSVLRAVGAAPGPSLDALSALAQALPAGLVQAPLPPDVAGLVATNPARVAAEQLRGEPGAWRRVCPVLDLTSACAAGRLGVEVAGDPAQAAVVWMAAYASPDDAAAAEAAAVERLGASAVDRVLRDEHVVVWMRATPTLPAARRDALERACRERLGG